MKSNTAQRTIEDLLAIADITVNGNDPWDMQVHNTDLFPRILREGSIGLGEAYMDGWWDAQRLDEFFFRVLTAHLDKKVHPSSLGLAYLQSLLVNPQRKSKAFDIGEKHYDIGNDLYTVMLDKRMTYTCGYWKDATTLAEAQEAKLDLICRKIGLEKGMRVLDIGCGWGSFAKFAAEKYGAEVVGITVSKEQVELGRKLCAGLPVEIRLQDYRDVDEKFDRVVSVGMFEHVGHKNYETFMDVVRRCLNDDGLFLLHTIGGNISSRGSDAWMDKYIFPGGMLPSIAQLGSAIEKKFVMEDWHNFGADYDKTLMAWFRNFDTAWPDLKNNYSERFYRMWKYYLMACAGGFRARNMELWQIVLSPHGVPGGYTSVR